MSRCIINWIWKVTVVFIFIVKAIDHQRTENANIIRKLSITSLRMVYLNPFYALIAANGTRLSNEKPLLDYLSSAESDISNQTAF